MWESVLLPRWERRSSERCFRLLEKNMNNINHMYTRSTIVTGRRFLHAVIAALLLVITAGTGAGQVERFTDDLWGNIKPAIPGEEQGAWRARTQLVWDNKLGKLTRRAYRAWDPFPSLELEFLWHPDNTHTDQPGAVAGNGVLSWRRRGAAAYDRTAVMAEYRGEMKDGRPHGEGDYRHVSGVTYRGAWKNGLFHGEGLLQLPNGDEYVGQFSEGRRHGQGAYVDAKGDIYRGGFLADARDGTGTITRTDASSYRAVFLGGVEVSGSRVDLTPTKEGELLKTQLASADDVHIGVIVDQEPAANAGDWQDIAHYNLHYQSKSYGKTLRIYPNNERLMGIWKGNKEIQLSEYEEFFRDAYPGWFELGWLGETVQASTVPIIFEFENQSSSKKRIVGAYLHFAKSITDKEPLMHLSVGVYHPCIGKGGMIRSTFQLENYGWGNAENVRISFALTDKDRHHKVGAYQRSIGLIGSGKGRQIDLIDAIAATGANIPALKTESFHCNKPNCLDCYHGNDWNNCYEHNCLDCNWLDEARSTGRFGILDDLVWLEDEFFHVYARGTLKYDWRHSDGTLKHNSSPFAAKLQVGRKMVIPECGDWGPPEQIRMEPYQMKLDQKNYRIPIALQEDIPAGATVRRRLSLVAEKSSQHDFHLVLQLADGSEVASRPINLLYMRPAVIEE
uniref:Uncharacterized conserved protein n=1 Tax=Candidatus Kentrum sp. FW TaxID=2126338 RepID=A0A450TAE5_9GAMM|nr:MAG: Uncharacterized conserved protein [Candidatus Kentron sp. FW]